MSRAEVATAHIRKCGPMTRMELADGLKWSPCKAMEAIREARRKSLLKAIGKTDRGQFLFAAVQTSNWPALSIGCGQ